MGTMRWLGAVACFAMALRVEATEWPTYQGNASHDGHVPVLLDPAGFGLKWEIAAGDGAGLNPVVAAEGKVFVTTTARFADGGLYVYDAIDGGYIWHVTFGDVASVNDPAYADGRVYVQVGNHSPGTYLRAYDATSGGLAFRAAFSAQWENYLAPTIVDGKVYIDGGYYGGIYRFDGTDGAEDWFQDLPQYDEWTPAVDQAYAYTYVGDNSPALYVFDRETGDPVFNIPDPNFDWNGWSMDIAIVLAGRNDAIAIHDGRLIRFDLAGRRIEWEEPRTFTGQPSVAGGLVYAIDAGALEVWDPVAHSMVWTWDEPADTLAGPMIVTDSHVFVCGANTTYAVDIATHQRAWSWPRAGQLALAEDTLYIAAPRASTLTAIQLAPGQVACPADGGPLVIGGVRASRSGPSDVAFTWAQDANSANGYHGYRFLDAADTPQANVVGTRVFEPATSADVNGTDIGAVIGAPSLYFYQIVGVCIDGTEGPIE